MQHETQAINSRGCADSVGAGQPVGRGCIDPLRDVSSQTDVVVEVDEVGGGAVLRGIKLSASQTKTTTADTNETRRCFAEMEMGMPDADESSRVVRAAHLIRLNIGRFAERGKKLTVQTEKV
jgi:hypothetical protein